MAGRSKPSMRAAFTSLKHKHYRSLWFSQAASFAGMQMQMVARGLLAYQLTGTYTSVGIVMMAWGIPQLMFSLLGGAVADRVNKRNVIIIVQTGTGVLSLLTAVLITIGQISIPWLFAMGLVQGTLFAFNMPARQALLAELVPQRDLMNAIALNNVAMNSTRIIGPMIAGILIAAWGVESAYYAQSFLYLFVLLFLFRLPPSTSHLAGSTSRGSVAAEIMIGLRYIASSRTMILLMIMAFIPTILGMPYMTLLPGFAVDELGLEPGAYGFMFTMTGIGAIVGSIAIAGMTEFPRKPLLQFTAGLGFGASLLGLGLLALPFGYVGALVALLGVGLFSTTYQTLNNTMIMAETKPEFYGRVMSVYMLTFSVFPLMSGPMGVVADNIGAVETFVLLGGGILAFMVLMLIVSPRYVFSRSVSTQFDEDEAATEAAPPPPPPVRAPLPAAGDSAPRPASALGFAAAATSMTAASAGVAPAMARRRAPRRDYIEGTEASLDYMTPREDGRSAPSETAQPISLAAHRDGATGAYGLVSNTNGTAAPIEATYGLVREEIPANQPVPVLRPVEAVALPLDEPVEATSDDPSEPDLRAIEAGDAVAPALRPSLATWEIAPRPTAEVRSSGRSTFVSAVAVAALAAGLSWLMRGSRGS
ncbi:MAG: MFS transporter [Dehalococcoidia bacterium]